MDVVIEGNKTPRIELGDIVVDKGRAFIATRYSIPGSGKKEYILRSLKDGYSGLNGYHDSLDDLQNKLTGEYEVYSKDKYELVLRRKE